jgi:hypothetical protein
MLVAKANDFKLMVRGMSCQNFIGGPKIRKSTPRARSWDASESAYGPEPTMATSDRWFNTSLTLELTGESAAGAIATDCGVEKGTRKGASAGTAPARMWRSAPRRSRLVFQAPGTTVLFGPRCDRLGSTTLPLPPKPAGQALLHLGPPHDAAWWAAQTLGFDYRHIPLRHEPLQQSRPRMHVEPAAPLSQAREPPSEPLEPPPERQTLFPVSQLSLQQSEFLRQLSPALAQAPPSGPPPEDVIVQTLDRDT